MAKSSALAFREDRATARDEVHYRARAKGIDGRAVELLVVNISAQGLMARCDADFQPGDRLSVVLPVLGAVDAEVRWSLGGRVGCELAKAVGLADYYEVLAAMVKNKG